MEAKLSPVNVIEETDFPNAWARAVQFVINNGVEIVFGGPDKNDRTKIERKTAKDSRQIIVLTGQAIVQVLSFQTHPKFKTKDIDFLKTYCRQLTREGVAAWSALPEDDLHKSAYNYLELIVNYPRIFGPGTIDQMQILKENLAEQIQHNIVSNRTQAITWQPEKHAKDHEPPCLQRIQVRYLGVDEKGRDVVEVEYNWRSRDLYNAWPSNEICVTAAVNHEVIIPNNCIITRIIDYSTSLHIYQGDWDEAKGVKPLATNPQTFRR